MIFLNNEIVFRSRPCRRLVSTVALISIVLFGMPLCCHSWLQSPSSFISSSSSSSSSSLAATTTTTTLLSNSSMVDENIISNPNTADNKKDVTTTSTTTTTTTAAAAAANTAVISSHQQRLKKLQGKLLKKVRQVCKDYEMLEDNDHIMVCVSGGKDSATLLWLLRILQQKLQQASINIRLTAVHVDQKQPGYNGTALVQWLQTFDTTVQDDDDDDNNNINNNNKRIPYHIIEEDTYSIVVDKTPESKSFCTVCSRLRRGILYSKAIELGCNKIALGHHADDAMETMLLNMLHGGQLKGMPARYTSNARGSNNKIGVLRPLMYCFESDILEYSNLLQFPILPCNLCSNQDQTTLQRPQMKLLLQTLQELSPNAKQNILNAMGDIRPSHLLDQSLRQSCGMDPITGEQQQQQDANNNNSPISNYDDDDDDDNNLFVTP